jgi:hypothetical protein
VTAENIKDLYTAKLLGDWAAKLMVSFISSHPGQLSLTMQV